MKLNMHVKFKNGKGYTIKGLESFNKIDMNNPNLFCVLGNDSNDIIYSHSTDWLDLTNVEKIELEILK